MTYRHSKRIWGSVVACIVLTAVCAGVPVPGQETSDSAASADLTTAPAPGGRPGRAEFDRIFARWKSLLKELRDLQQRFVIADEDGVDKIRTEYMAKLDQGKAMLVELRAAALKAYAEAPDADRELTRFLVKMADDDVAHDQYEAAREITQVMLDHSTQERSVYDLAGVAAFALHDFDAAEKYLREADSYGVLKRGKDFLPNIAEVRSTWEGEQPIRAQEAAKDDLPRVRLQTSKGNIVLELFENEAPGTVGNFIDLVKKGFYDGLTFHRVLPNFMAQAGCPRGDGTGGPGYTIYDECHGEQHRNHFRGSLSMAKGDRPDTGGSQFFLTFVPTPHLNGKHTVFGRVIEGIEVLAQLERRDPSNPEQAAITPDRIVKAEVLRDRGHPYVPNRVATGSDQPPASSAQ